MSKNPPIHETLPLRAVVVLLPLLAIGCGARTLFQG